MKRRGKSRAGRVRRQMQEADTAGLLLEGYHRLYQSLGPQHWWPGNTPVEVMAGAILTQNTNWRNVELAIRALKSRRMLSIRSLARARPVTLETLVRPTGYFRVKARRLKCYFAWMLTEFSGSTRGMKALPVEELRGRMLAEVSGVGPETADSIILYALGLRTFVIDAYTRRVLVRHGVRGAQDAPYDSLRVLFQDSLPRDAGLYNEYHALLVAAAKRFCGRGAPDCVRCPLDGLSLSRIRLPSLRSGRGRSTRRRQRRRQR